MKRTFIELTEEDAVEARKLLKKSDKKSYPRLMVIALKGEGHENKEIASITGFSADHVTRIIKKYVQEGFESLLKDRRTSNNRKVSQKEEEQFLAEFEKLAEQGKIIVVKDMRIAFQEKFSVTISVDGFYRLLKRHGWRKVMPRTQHPKVADASVIEASKKLT